jgi:DnaK suppressor protein
MDDQRARELLDRERNRVEQAITDLEQSMNESEELSHIDQHPADTGSEVFQREHDAGRAIQLRDELAAIERAEERLRRGEYGRSVRSGEPIPDARLEAVPWAERTVAEQESYERTG